MANSVVQPAIRHFFYDLPQRAGDDFYRPNGCGFDDIHLKIEEVCH